MEDRRRREEALRREKERLERELEEREMEEARQLYDLANKNKKGVKGVAGKEGMVLDKRQLMLDAHNERAREQQELERKMLKMARQLDHVERARREEEAPMIVDAGKKRVVSGVWGGGGRGVGGKGGGGGRWAAGPRGGVREAWHWPRLQLAVQVVRRAVVCTIV